MIGVTRHIKYYVGANILLRSISVCGVFVIRKYVLCRVSR